MRLVRRGARPRRQGLHRRRRRGRAPRRRGRRAHDPAGHRRADRFVGAEGDSTRCSRPCRCRPASRSRRCRSASPARPTPPCSPRRSSASPTRRWRRGWCDYKKKLADKVEQAAEARALTADHGWQMAKARRYRALDLQCLRASVPSWSRGAVNDTRIVTFGCRVNQADSLRIEEDLRRARRRRDCRRRDADLVIVNTCSVTATADQGARQTIRRIARENPAAQIVVTGCYATRCAGRGRRAAGVVRVVANAGQATSSSIGSSSAADALDDGRAVRRRRRSVRRADRAGRRRPHRASRFRVADRLRGALRLLHHPDDARRVAQPADRGRSCARSSASPRRASRKSR